LIVVLRAVAEHGVDAYERLIADGHAPKRVYAKMVSLVGRGYLDCGVVPHRGWLTDRGREALEGE
jgi:hypothetical protein